MVLGNLMTFFVDLASWRVSTPPQPVAQPRDAPWRFMRRAAVATTITVKP